MKQGTVIEEKVPVVAANYIYHFYFKKEDISNIHMTQTIFLDELKKELVSD